jgi:hypothetical protein
MFVNHKHKVFIETYSGYIDFIQAWNGAIDHCTEHIAG